MSALKLNDVPARVVAWHNRHPLARRIDPSHVHSIGGVGLPFASDRPLPHGGAPAAGEPIDVAQLLQPPSAEPAPPAEDPSPEALDDGAAMPAQASEAHGAAPAAAADPTEPTTPESAADPAGNAAADPGPEAAAHAATDAAEAAQAAEAAEPAEEAVGPIEAPVAAPVEDAPVQPPAVDPPPADATEAHANAMRADEPGGADSEDAEPELVMALEDANAPSAEAHDSPDGRQSEAAMADSAGDPPSGDTDPNAAAPTGDEAGAAQAAAADGGPPAGPTLPPDQTPAPPILDVEVDPPAPTPPPAATGSLAARLEAARAAAQGGPDGRSAAAAVAPAPSWWQRLLARWRPGKAEAAAPRPGTAVPGGPWPQGHAGSLQPLFDRKLLGRLAPKVVATWARRHGARQNLAPAGWPQRWVKPDPALLHRARGGKHAHLVQLHLITAAVEIDGRRTRVLLDAEGDLLGARVMSPWRMGAAAGTAAMAIGLGGWAGIALRAAVPVAEPMAAATPALQAASAVAELPGPMASAVAPHAAASAHAGASAVASPHVAEPALTAASAATPIAAVAQAPASEAMPRLVSTDAPQALPAGNPAPPPAATAPTLAQAGGGFIMTRTPPPAFPERRASGPLVNIRPLLSAEQREAARLRSEQARAAALGEPSPVQATGSTERQAARRPRAPAGRALFRRGLRGHDAARIGRSAHGADAVGSRPAERAAAGAHRAAATGQAVARRPMALHRSCRGRTCTHADVGPRPQGRGGAVLTRPGAPTLSRPRPGPAP